MLQNVQKTTKGTTGDRKILENFVFICFELLVCFALFFCAHHMDVTDYQQDTHRTFPGCEVQRRQNHVVCALSIFVSAHGAPQHSQRCGELDCFERKIQKQIIKDVEFI